MSWTVFEYVLRRNSVLGKGLLGIEGWLSILFGVKEVEEGELYL